MMRRIDLIWEGVRVCVMGGGLGDGPMIGEREDITCVDMG